MFTHNLLLIYRNFKRFRSTFFINLIGLSTGLACALLIYLWVNDEVSVDKFHEKENQLFRVMLNDPRTESIKTSSSTQAILAEALAEEMPEVEYAVASTGGTIDFTLSSGDHHILAAGLFAEKDFFTIFSFDLIQGDKNRALSDKKVSFFRNQQPLLSSAPRKILLEKHLNGNFRGAKTKRLYLVFLKTFYLIHPVNLILSCPLIFTRILWVKRVYTGEIMDAARLSF